MKKWRYERPTPAATRNTEATGGAHRAHRRKVNLKDRECLTGNRAQHKTRWLQVSHVSAQDTFTLLVDPSSRRRPGGYTWAPDAACSPIVVWRSPGLLSATKPKIVFLKPGIIRSRRKRKAYSNWSWRAVFKNSIWSKHELNWASLIGWDWHPKQQSGVKLKHPWVQHPKPTEMNATGRSTTEKFSQAGAHWAQ